MKVSDLNAVIKLASNISNKSSITSLYRSIELGAELLRCCSEFGNMEIAVPNTGLTAPVLLDGAALQGITGSLPAGGEITLTPNNGKIDYKCGNAKGSLNIVISDHRIPQLNHTTFPWSPPPELANALVLASSACTAAAVSVGLYGIVLEPEGDKLRLLSTNAVALASVVIDKGTFPELSDAFLDPTTKRKKVTLRPPVPAVIAAFISSCPNCTLDVTTDGIFIQGDWLRAHLPVSSNLQHDLKELADKYTLCTQSATINSAAVKMFIGRARALSDKNAFFLVALSVENGTLTLKHASIASTSEEIFLCEGLDPALNYKSVEIDAEMLRVSLPFVTNAIFDYLGESKLILKGTSPEFKYVVSGGGE